MIMWWGGGGGEGGKGENDIIIVLTLLHEKFLQSDTLFSRMVICPSNLVFE